MNIIWQIEMEEGIWWGGDDYVGGILDRKRRKRQVWRTSSSRWGWRLEPEEGVRGQKGGKESWIRIERVLEVTGGMGGRLLAALQTVQ